MAILQACVAGQKFFAGYVNHPQHFEQLGNILHKQALTFAQLH